MKISNLNAYFAPRAVHERGRGIPRGEARGKMLKNASLDLSDNVQISEPSKEADEGKEIGLAMLGTGIAIPGIIAGIGIFSLNPPAGVAIALSSLILGGLVIAAANK